VSITLLNPPNTSGAERIARHIRMCKEMAEIAMRLAEAAAARAQIDLAATPPDAQTKKPAPSPLAAALLFTRLCRVIQTAITLENRLATGQAAPTAPTRTDPRRATLRCVINNATADTPNANALKRQAFDRLDQALALDPNCEYTADAILGPICTDLGLKYDRPPPAARPHTNGANHHHRRR
jgi:hypothetical protein